jgi:hypothetical protein
MGALVLKNLIGISIEELCRLLVLWWWIMEMAIHGHTPKIILNMLLAWILAFPTSALVILTARPLNGKEVGEQPVFLTILFIT